MLLSGVIVGFAFGAGVIMIMVTPDDPSGYACIFIGFLALVLAVVL